MLLATAAGFLLPVAALFTYQIQAASRNALAEAQGDVLVLAQVTAARYASFLADTERVLQALAQRPQVRAMDPAQCDPLLSQVQTVLPLFANVALMARDFTIICSGARESGGARASAAAIPGVAEALDRNGLVVSEPFVGPITGRRVLSISYPVIGTDGGIVGRVGLPVDLERWQALIDQPLLPAGATLGVVSPRGVLLARIPQLPLLLGQDVSTAGATRHFLGKESGVTTADGLDGDGRVYGFTAVPGAGWRVYASRLESDVLAPVYAVTWRSSALPVGTLALLVLFFVFLSRWVARHAAALARVSRALAGGEPARIPEIGPRELRCALASVNAAVATRREAESALRESERQHRALVGNLPGAVYRCRNDPDYTAEYVSPAIERLTGHPAEAILRGSVTFGAMTHPDDRERVWRGVQDGLATNGRYALEFRIIRADGEERWFADHGSGIYGEDGALEAVEGFLLDVSERKQAEAAAREDALRLQSIVQAANVGLWDWDLATDGVYFSPQWKRQIGYDNQEINNDFAEWQSRVHPEDLDQTLQMVRHAIAESQAGFQIEYRLRHKDGSWRWILATGALLSGADGKPVRLLGSNLDVTGLKQAELAVLESRQRLLDLIDGLGPQIFVGLLALDGTLLEANQSALAAANVTRVDVLGKPVHETPWVAHSARVQKEFRDAVAAAAAGATVRFDTQLAVAGWARAWVDFTLQPLHDTAGVIRNLVASAAVITERKQAEDELRRSAAQLDAAQERAHLGSWELDLETGQASWSREMFRLYHRDPARGVPPVAEFIEMIDPRDRALIDNLPKQVVAGGGSISIEYRTNPAQGPVRHLNLVVYGTPEADGRIRRLAGTVLDTTLRKQAEDELRGAAERMQALARRLVEAQEAEQRRMSVELHDRIGQNLTALGINLKLVADALPAALAQRLATRLRDSATLLESTVGSVRALMRELRPAVLEDYGLLAGLRLLGQEFEARTGIATAVTGAEPVPRPAPAVELGLYRIVQEALNNVAKYARARHVRIELAGEPGRVAMSLADDGIGFDPVAAATGPRTRWGLLVMQERAEAVGGRLQVSSTPGHGTRISVEVARAA